MKLRNIFIAALTICAFASCSKNDEIDNSPKEQVDAYVSFATSTNILTKADGADGGTNDGTNVEKAVKQLTAFIFKEDGSLAGFKVATDEEVKAMTVGHILIKVSPEDDLTKPSSDKFIAVIVANANEQVKSVTKLGDLTTTTTLDLTHYNPVNKGDLTLPMISKKIEFTGVVPMVVTVGEDHTENWVSEGTEGTAKVSLTKNENEKIYLNRLVARVDLKSIQVNFANNTNGASFNLKRVFVANVRSTSPFISEDNANGSALWKGFQSKFFNKAKGDVIVGIDKSGNDVVKGELKDGQNVKPALLKELSVLYSEMDGTETDPTKFKKQFLEPALFYIFKNPSSQVSLENTRLILEGTYHYSEADVEGELRHFHVVLNKAGVKEVLPNYIYSLTVNITGEGSPNEDDILTNAHVAVTLDVEPWRIITQNETDTN